MKTHKLIFLDIDGVLNSIRSCIALKGYSLPVSLNLKPRHQFTDVNDDLIAEFDPVAVGMLRELVKRTGAEIVISSTWRLGADFDYFKKIFSHYNWEDFPIIGITPDLRETGKRIWRGEEVQAWIDEFEKDGTHKVEKYICIDDDGDFKPAMPLVQTDGKDGFSYANFEIALHLLDPENNPIAPLARKNF